MLSLHKPGPSLKQKSQVLGYSKDFLTKTRSCQKDELLKQHSPDPETVPVALLSYPRSQIHPWPLALSVTQAPSPQDSISKHM